MIKFTETDRKTMRKSLNYSSCMIGYNMRAIFLYLTFQKTEFERLKKKINAIEKFPEILFFKGIDILPPKKMKTHEIRNALPAQIEYEFFGKSHEVLVYSDYDHIRRCIIDGLTEGELNHEDLRGYWKLKQPV